MLSNTHVPLGRALSLVSCFASAATTIVLSMAAAAESAFAQSPPFAQESRLPADDRFSSGVVGGLTLQKAIAVALEGNLDLSVALLEVEATRGQVLQGQVRPNPELAYSLEDLRAQSRSQSLQINLPIERGGKRTARIAAAERGSDIAVEELNARRVEIRAAVVAAFYDTLAAQARTALAKDSVDLAQRATDAVAKRVAAGKISPVEETKSRVAEAGVRVELAQAQSEQRNARSRLVSLLGANPPSFTQLAGNVDSMPDVPAADQIRQRLAVSPTLRQARLEVERRKSLSEVERSKQVQDVTLSLGVRHPNDLRRDQLLLGLSVPLPIFDRNQGNLLEALRREDKAQAELEALSARLNTEVFQARERLEAIRGEIAVLQRDVLPGAKSAYDAASLGFEYGKFNFLEVLDAQRTYFAAQSQYLKALTESHRAAADIDRVIGETTLIRSPLTKQD